MISKYFLWTSALFTSILLFSSCLNSSDGNIEYPTDPQIYAVSIASATDSMDILSGVSFTIDQVNGRIFNKEPLPYLFHVDSVVLSLSGSSTYYSFAAIELILTEDSNYYWNGSDSIALSRLQKIVTTAPDAATSKTYSFELNIYQEDPDSIKWEKITPKGDYPVTTIEDQRTVVLNNKFISYFRSGSTLRAVSSSVSDGENWANISLSGIPAGFLISTLISTNDVLYALDSSGTLYYSDYGLQWESISTDYEIMALYGKLPFSSANEVLTIIHQNDALFFAKINRETGELTVMNKAPEDIPVSGFSAISVESSTSYASKYILLAGGSAWQTPSDETELSNNKTWVLQESNESITYIRSEMPEDINAESLKGCSLFFYDDNPWLMVTSSTGINKLMRSKNFGISWTIAGSNQAFPVSPIHFRARRYASVVTDDNNIWIFGGISLTDTSLTDIWRGKLNKFSLN